MSMETRRQEQDIRVYRCDLTQDTDRCVRETASFHSEGGVTVFMDPAWTVVRAGLGEERQFCSWDHQAEWTAREHAAALAREEHDAVDMDYGDFAVSLRRAAQDRAAREESSVVKTRALAEERNRSAELLGMTSDR